MQPFQVLELSQVLRNQWKSAAELQDLQDKKLRRLVRHAYANVPYYRRLFDTAGLRPADIRGVGDLHRIPVSSKREFAAIPPNELLAQSVPMARCRSSRSSGATGVPLNIVHDRRDLTVTNFGFLRTFMAHGYRPWHRRVEFTGSRNVPKGRAWYEHVALLRRRVLSDAGDPADWVTELAAWQPHMIIGYVMMLRQLAAQIQAQHITSIRPRLVFSTSAVLDVTTRAYLSSIFGAPVFDYYASEEARLIAWECGRCPGYHINADLLIVEVLDDSEQPVPPGVEGEIAITNLHSSAMPFIRYRQGDVGVASAEKPICGRALPLLASVTGRSDDFIVTSDGRHLSPRLFYYALWTVPGIKEFKLIQTSPNCLHVEIVVTEAYSRASAQQMRDNLLELMDPAVEIRTAIVSAIPRVGSEKFQSFVSLAAGRQLSQPRR